MSINIGYLGTNYGTNNIGSMDNRLVINTYNTSNTINLNTNVNSTSNAIINYKNLFKSGVINNDYVIQNSNNDNAFVLTNSNININKNFLVNTDITCKSLLNTCNDFLNLTSNINIYLYRNNNLNFYNAETNAINYNFNTNRFTSYNNAYFNQNMYVNTIRPNSENGFVSIYKANLIDNVVESTNVITTFSINNIKTEPYNKQTFSINRFFNGVNIFEINTCNLYNNVSSNTYNNPPIFKHFTINNNGLIGIGNKEPDAPLSISANYKDIPYVFKYSGEYLSDSFNITKNANVGIGTTNPVGLLHINRNDDKYDVDTSNISYENIRNQPLLKLNIDFDSTKNIITNSNNDIIINSDNFLAIRKIDEKFIEVNNIDIFNNTSQLDHNIYILNNSLYSVVNNNLNNFANIANDASCNIIYKTYTLNNFLRDNTFNDRNTIINYLFNFRNNIYYPDNIFISDYTTDYRYTVSETVEVPGTNIFRYRKTHNYTHGVILMSEDTYNTGGYMTSTTSSSAFKYNVNNFTKITSNYNISKLMSTRSDVINGITSNLLFVQDVNLALNFYIEKKDLKTSYNTSNILIQSAAPDFLYLSSNNEFKASISNNGLLSLGSKYSLDDNNYLLYIPEKKAFINNAEINTITTQQPALLFDNKNLDSINNIKSVSANIITGNFDIINSSNIDNSNITIHNQLNIKNITMNSSNIHLTNKLSICSDILDTTSYIIDDTSLIKITVNSNVIVDDNIFKNSDGLVITNNNYENISLTSNINPSISIYGKEGSYPLIKLSKNKITEDAASYTVEEALNNYFIRLATKTYFSGGTSYLDHFEVCCDNIRDFSNKTEYYNSINLVRPSTNIIPSFIKHIKNYNLLCFGELNNICIKCDNKFSEIYGTQVNSAPSGTFTNNTNKISLGIPFNDNKVLENNTPNTIEDWAQIFNNKICNPPQDGFENDAEVYSKYSNNMLNIFGNTGIWSISGNNIFKANMNVDNNIDSGCDIVIGNDTALSANTSINMYGKITTTAPIKTYADSNLMINFLPINNPVEKIKRITGNSYTRTDINNVREIGLKAQEVQAEFPELVTNHNDKSTIQYGNMAAIFVEAIKELSSKLDTINSTLTTINDRLDTLETNVSSINTRLDIIDPVDPVEDPVDPVDPVEDPVDPVVDPVDDPVDEDPVDEDPVDDPVEDPVD
jgi:hypothetical protein